MVRDEGLESFEDWLLAEGLSPRSARAYATDLRGFLEFAGDGPDGSLAAQTIGAWLDALASEGLATTTLVRKLTSVRRYCRWVVSRGVLDADPTAEIAVTVPDREPAIPSWEEISAVLVAPDWEDALGLRDRAMMALLVDSGMQLRELCGLNYHECSRDGDELIAGEGPRLRRVRTRYAHRPLRRYLYEVRQLQAGDALFLSVRGRRISERAVQHRVLHYARAAGVSISVEDLIHRGRLLHPSDDARHAARRLGFVRPDALERRYRVEPAEREHAPPEEFPPHPFLKPLDGMHPGGMPRPHGEPLPAPSRARTWERLEMETRKRMQLPHPAEECWSEVTGLIDMAPEDRVRAYAAPVAGLIRDMQRRKLPPPVAAIVDDESARRSWASDTGLLTLRSRALEISSDLRMWADFRRRFPGYVEETKRGTGQHEDGPDRTDASVAVLAFGSPERPLGWANLVLATHEGQVVLRTLLATQWERLIRIRECASDYYDLPASAAARRELDAALVVACITGLVLCDPDAVERGRVSDVVEEPAAMYFLDTVSVVLFQLLRLLGQIEDGSGVSKVRDDKLFVEAFEQEWDRLLPHTNAFFGFAVVPRLSYEDMVRYHGLRYAPHGDLASIPYEVGDYLVHQAKGSMHFLRPFMPTPLQDAFFDCVRPLYEPLLKSTNEKARWALTQEGREQDGDEVFDCARSETEAAFRKAYDRYDFYQHPLGGKRATVSSGLLGLGRREDMRRLAIELGIECEQDRTPFAAYARGFLKRLVQRLRRETSKGDAEGLEVQPPASGRSYYTVSKMAKAFGRKEGCNTDEALRRSAGSIRALDDLLRPTRVADVFGEHRTGRKGLSGETRLYPVDEETRREYKTLLGSKHPRLEAEKLRTETEVAEWLKVDVWWLRNRRKRGLLEAGRRGHFVVYNVNQRKAAERLLEEENADPKET